MGWGGLRLGIRCVMIGRDLLLVACCFFRFFLLLVMVLRVHWFLFFVEGCFLGAFFGGINKKDSTTWEGNGKGKGERKAAL